MSVRFAAVLAWILGRRRRTTAAAQLVTARRRAAWQQIEYTLAELRQAA